MQTNKTVDVTLVGAGLYKHQHLQSCIHHKIHKNDSNDSNERIKP